MGIATPRRSPLLLGLMLTIMLLVGWRAFSLGMADTLARSAPGRALWWQEDHPEALLLEGERLLQSGVDAQRVEELAKRALHGNPLDGRGYRLLATLAERSGDQARAARLYALAIRRSPRDLPSHAWLFEHHLAAGRIAAALPHADRMLRIQPQLAPRLFPILLALTEEGAATKPLAELLAGAPPWREKFLLQLLAQPRPGQHVDELMAATTRAGVGLTQTELAAWLDRLIAHQQWQRAYVAWAGQLQAPIRSLGNVYNGGFESQPSGLGFDWRFEHTPGASIELLAGPGVTGRQALSVAFEQQRVDFHHVRQLLVLPPGRYLLEGHQRADGLRTASGLVWTLACAGSLSALAGSEPLKGDTGWTPFSLEFEVPGQGCGGQWLQLALSARMDAERMASGRAWFDELRIVRLR